MAEINLDEWMGKWDVVMPIKAYKELTARLRDLEADRDSWRERVDRVERRLEFVLQRAEAAEQIVHEMERDAARYRWLRDTLTAAVGGGIEVNDDALVYQEAEPGKEVRVYWYPDTPVGFYEAHGSTIDNAIDAARGESNAG